MVGLFIIIAVIFLLFSGLFGALGLVCEETKLIAIHNNVLFYNISIILFIIGIIPLLSCAIYGFKVSLYKKNKREKMKGLSQEEMESIYNNTPEMKRFNNTIRNMTINLMLTRICRKAIVQEIINESFKK